MRTAVLVAILIAIMAYWFRSDHRLPRSKSDHAGP
jgi:hypothetical protein